MSVAATLRGAAAGLLAAAILAALVALLVYHTGVSPALVRWTVRLLGFVVSGVAGWVAGRAAESGAVLHGLMAAEVVAAVGHVAALWGGWLVGPLWSSLLTAAVLGAAGGLVAAIR
jgi:putative membrane protein (TIGR04086 family)